MTPERPRPAAGPRRVRGVRRGGRLLDRARGGTWRVAVADHSMIPAIEPGDWLLVDPTTDRWPRRGSVVVFREPGSATLAVKRVAGRPGDWIPFSDGWLHLADDEAWLLGDASDEALVAALAGRSIDSRRYGPVPLDHLVGRVWFRYGPFARIGRIGPPPPDLLRRGHEGP